jgi:hypothetical protein
VRCFPDRTPDLTLGCVRQDAFNHRNAGWSIMPAQFKTGL